MLLVDVFHCIASFSVLFITSTRSANLLLPREKTLLLAVFYAACRSVSVIRLSFYSTTVKPLACAKAYIPFLLKPEYIIILDNGSFS